MRIGILSDVHSNLHALEAVLDHFHHEQVDHIYCLGDTVGYNAHPLECTRLIRKTSDRILLGNHDWAAIHGSPPDFNPLARAGIDLAKERLQPEDLAFYQNLQPEAEFDLGPNHLHIAHASPDNPLWEYVFPSVARNLYENLAATVPDRKPTLVAIGHTHVPMLLTSQPHAAAAYTGVPTQNVETGIGKRKHPLILVNPGSVGQPRDGDPRASCLTLNTETMDLQFHRITYDVDAAAEAIRQAGLPHLLGDRLAVGR